MKVSKLKPNPTNPRIIKDDKFKKLVQSIKDFPQMMELRPIVIDETMTTLGGNMRLKAIQELGMKEIPDSWVKKASELTEEQKNEFIIKDNVGFGEWNWDAIANEWDADKVAEWGLPVPFYGIEENNLTEQDLDITEQFEPYGISKGQQRVVFIFDGESEAESFLQVKGLLNQCKKFNNAWQINMCTQSI